VSADRAVSVLNVLAVEDAFLAYLSCIEWPRTD